MASFPVSCATEATRAKTMASARSTKLSASLREYCKYLCFNFLIMSTIPSVLRTDTLSPLPNVLSKGLIAVSFFGLLSLAAASTLFVFLTYRLTRWYWKGQLSNGANQFLLLIYNLLLADIQQALAFSLTASYVAKDKIEVGTTTCWANGKKKTPPLRPKANICRLVCLDGRFSFRGVHLQYLPTHILCSR